MVVLFCGIPGSGKTTIAKKLATRLKKQWTVRLFVSDKLTPPVYRKFFRLLKLNRGKYDFLLFDATFYKKKWRDQMKKLAKGEKVITVYLRCLVKTAVLRNKKRRFPVPAQAVHIVSAEMEAPRKPDVILDTERLAPLRSAEKVLRLVRRRLAK